MEWDIAEYSIKYSGKNRTYREIPWKKVRDFYADICIEWLECCRQRTELKKSCKCSTVPDIFRGNVKGIENMKRWFILELRRGWYKMTSQIFWVLFKWNGDWSGIFLNDFLLKAYWGRGGCHTRKNFRKLFLFFKWEVVVAELDYSCELVKKGRSLDICSRKVSGCPDYLI